MIGPVLIDSVSNSSIKVFKEPWLTEWAPILAGTKVDIAPLPHILREALVPGHPLYRMAVFYAWYINNATMLRFDQLRDALICQGIVGGCGPIKSWWISGRLVAGLRKMDPLLRELWNTARRFNHLHGLDIHFSAEVGEHGIEAKISTFNESDGYEPELDLIKRSFVIALKNHRFDVDYRSVDISADLGNQVEIGLVDSTGRFRHYVLSLHRRGIAKMSVTRGNSMEYSKEWIIADKTRLEAGYVNNPDDPGKETNHGITIDVARKYGYTGPMADLPKSLAYEIYESIYWDGICGDRLVEFDPMLADKMFDIAINAGIGRAVKFLQRLLNVNNRKGELYPDLKVDGDIGDRTISALYRYGEHRGQVGRHRILMAMVCLQMTHYIDISDDRESLETFTYGWMGRAYDDIIEYAKKIDG